MNAIEETSYRNYRRARREIAWALQEAGYDFYPHEIDELLSLVSGPPSPTDAYVKRRLQCSNEDAQAIGVVLRRFRSSVQ